MEILDLSRAAHMDPGAIAFLNAVTYADMLLVHIGDGHILGNNIMHLLLQFLNVQIRLGFREVQRKAVAYIVMAVADHILFSHEHLTDILSGVRHQAVLQRFIDLLPDLLRLGTKNTGSGDEHLLTHTHQHIGIGAQQGVDQVKMLYHHPAALVQRFVDGIGQHTHLGKAILKPDIQMVGMGREEGKTTVLLQQRQRTHIHTIIVIGQLQTGEHAPNQGALSGAGFTNDADKLIIGRKIHLRQILTQRIHTLRAPGRVIGAKIMGRSAFSHGSSSLNSPMWWGAKGSPAPPNYFPAALPGQRWR